MIEKIIEELKKHYNVKTVFALDNRKQSFKVVDFENKGYTDLEVSTISNVFCDLHIYCDGEKFIKALYFPATSNPIDIAKDIRQTIEQYYNPDLVKTLNRIKDLSYYYEEDGVKRGPFKFEELKTKSLKSSTLIWRSDANDWNRASQFVELKDFLTQSPPLLPSEKRKLEKENSLRVTLNTIRVIFGILSFISGIGGIIGYLVRMNEECTFQEHEAKDIRFRYSLLIFAISLFLLFYKKMKRLIN